MVLETLTNFDSQINWFFTLIFGIILSIIGNLLTPRVKNVWDYRSEQKINSKMKSLKWEKKEMTEFFAKPFLLTSYYSEVILKVFMLFAIANIIDKLPGLNGVFAFILNMATVLIYYIAFMSAVNAIGFYKKVKNFESYIEKIDAKIKEANLHYLPAMIKTNLQRTFL